MEIDLGEIVAGKETSKEIEIINDSEFMYGIKKLTPYCSCIKILDHTKGYASSLDPLIIKLSIKKNKATEGITKVEMIMDSPTEHEKFIIIDFKYKIIEKNEKSTISGRGSRRS